METWIIHCLGVNQLAFPTNSFQAVKFPTHALPKSISHVKWDRASMLLKFFILSIIFSANGRVELDGANERV